MLTYILTVFFIAFNIQLCSSQSCEDFKTCGQCIGNQLRCVWCPDKGYQEPRCTSALNVKIDQCSDIINPISQGPENFEDNYDNVSNAQFYYERKINNSILKTNRLTVKIRPGEKVTFNLNYKPTLNHPVDIYYLFDNSYTMKDYKELLKDQAEMIYKNMTEITNNVQFGAGSFVEKMALPFNNPDNPTNNSFNTFNNHLSLTENITSFVDTIGNVNYTGNYDNPECGLDGLMQVIVCKDIIKWRNGSRHMVIYSTDAPYHSAGDGKFVGAYKYNDMQCHLSENNDVNLTYTTHVYGKTESLLYDYPSVSHINKVARENDIIIIFAVLEKVEKEYKALSEAIKGSTYVELNDKSGNLVTQIKNLYKGLVRDLILNIEGRDNSIDIELDPPCLNKYEQRCKYDNENQFVNINVTIGATRCPGGNSKHKIIISPNGLSSDQVTIDIEVLCECDCEKKGSVSPECGNYGTLQCGICKCNTNRYGRRCECSGNEIDMLNCKGRDGTECAGIGSCTCGKCDCPDDYAGHFCNETNQCKKGRKVCSDNGVCVNNQCNCNDGWSKKYCDCTTNEDKCKGFNKKVCSGHGSCECGHCNCDKGYHQDYCQSCSTCASERCKELENYVVCKYDNRKNDSTCDRKVVESKIIVSFKNKSEFLEWMSDKSETCETTSNSRIIVFKYLDGNMKTDICIQEELGQEPMTKWYALGGSLLGVVIIGILTLIAWKCLMDMRDAREYKKFQEELKALDDAICTNPHYIPPTVSINNPAYNAEN